MMKLDRFRVELAIARSGETVKAIAHKAGVSDRTIYRGFESHIRCEKVGKIARALGVDVEEIIVKEG